MMINANAIVSMTEANQNFSKVTRLVDEKGLAYILKNNKPCYVLLPFQEYDKMKSAREKLISETADKIIADNLEAFQELAK